MIALILLLVGLALMSYAAVLGVRATAHRRRPWSGRTTRALAWAAVAWTVAVALVLLVAPMGTRVSASSNGSETVTTTSHTSLLETEGAGVIVILLVPVAVALAGALGRGAARQRRIVAGSVLLVFCLLGAMSVGLFFVPAAAALLTAGLKTPDGRVRAAT
jgi:hypothetical protein